MTSHLKNEMGSYATKVSFIKVRTVCDVSSVCESSLCYLLPRDVPLIIH